MPDHTCPTIDELYEWLEDEKAPEWTREILDSIRRDNVNLRYVAKTAIRELKKWEDGTKSLP
jgi:hypothetical protein